jgi:hypothetical protein
MTRDVKVGLFVSCSFLCLVGVVVTTKLHEKGQTTAEAQLASDTESPAGNIPAPPKGKPSKPNVKPAEGKPLDVKPVDEKPVPAILPTTPAVKPLEVKPLEVARGDLKPVQTIQPTTPDVKPLNGKPIEVQPIQTISPTTPDVKPLDVKPMDVKPLDGKPAQPIQPLNPDTNPLDVKPLAIIQSTPTDVKPELHVSPQTPDVKPLDVKPVQSISITTPDVKPTDLKSPSSFNPPTPDVKPQAGNPMTALPVPPDRGPVPVTVAPVSPPLLTETKPTVPAQSPISVMPAPVVERPSSPLEPIPPPPVPAPEISKFIPDKKAQQEAIATSKGQVTIPPPEQALGTPIAPMSPSPLQAPIILPPQQITTPLPTIDGTQGKRGANLSAPNQLPVPIAAMDEKGQPPLPTDKKTATLLQPAVGTGAPVPVDVTHPTDIPRPVQSGTPQTVAPGVLQTTTAPITPAGPSPLPTEPLQQVGARVQQPILPAQVISYTEKQPKIQPGDTFQGLAKAYYGNESYAAALEQHNRTHEEATASLKEGRLTPGERVFIPSDKSLLESRYPDKIPSLRTLPPVSSPVSFKAAPVSTQYRVRGPSEQLFSIALKTLNNGDRWPEIRDLNPTVSAERPVPAEMVLLLPPGASRE